MSFGHQFLSNGPIFVHETQPRERERLNWVQEPLKCIRYCTRLYKAISRM